MPELAPADDTLVPAPAELCEDGRTRVLHVLVPETALLNARRAAFNSDPQLSFKRYIAKMLLNARPLK